jgi:hypothetical protein
MRYVLSSADTAHPLSEAQGHDFLIRFSVGDPTPRNQLTPMINPDPLATHAGGTQPPHQANPVIQAREFGLIIEHGTDEAHLIMGETWEVSWAPFTKVGRCVAHVHPLINATFPSPPRRPTSGWAPRGGEGDRFADAVAKPSAYGAYMPTAGDVSFTSARELPVHTVYTPYRIQGDRADRTLHAPRLVPPDRPLLSWDISEASETDKEYGALITALADRVPFWSSRVTINRRTADDFPMTIGFTFTTPDNFFSQ